MRGSYIEREKRSNWH